MKRMEMAKGRAVRWGRGSRFSRLTAAQMARMELSPRRKDWHRRLRQLLPALGLPAFQAWIYEQRWGVRVGIDWRQHTHLEFTNRLAGGCHERLAETEL